MEKQTERRRGRGDERQESETGTGRDTATAALYTLYCFAYICSLPFIMGSVAMVWLYIGRDQITMSITMSFTAVAHSL